MNIAIRAGLFETTSVGRLNLEYRVTVVLRWERTRVGEEGVERSRNLRY